MNTSAVNFQRIAALFVIIALIITMLVMAQVIIKPIVFALVFSIMLRPLCNWFDRWMPWQWLSVSLTFITVFLPVLILTFVFYLQFKDVVSDLPSISEKIEQGISKLTYAVEENIPSAIKSEESWLQKSTSTILDTVQSGLTASSAVLASFFLTFLYTFLILLYRKSFRLFIVNQFRERVQESAKTVLRKIQRMNERYLYGMLMVILILGVLNSLGLWVIGIKYPFFWGFLGGVLAIIPYVGTLLGGLLPFVYAFATTENYWQPLSVIVFYFFIQQLEGNFITPKVVGSSVKLNPLAAIFALVLGAFLWGIAGAILAIPLLAIIRIVFSYIDVLKPYALLMSNDLYDKSYLFEEKYDKDKYRLLSFFRSGSKMKNSKE